MKRIRELGMAPQPIAVALEIDDVAAMQDATQKCRRRYLIPQELAPILKSLV